MRKKFQKKIEDFICEHCGNQVKGSGYTNHCPICLWSKHVDVNPGDRYNDCRGAMRPVSAYIEKDRWKIEHVCERCGQKKEIFAAKDDELDEIIKLSISGIK